MLIHESQTTRSTDHGQVQFVAEASALGMKPGEWPTEIQMTCAGDEVIVFQKDRSVGNEDLIALVYVEYDSGSYDELHILND